MFGAGNEVRTRDPNHGKVMLYQLSYSRIRNGKHYIENFVLCKKKINFSIWRRGYLAKSIGMRHSFMDAWFRRQSSFFKKRLHHSAVDGDHLTGNVGGILRH